jgi:putative two-component system response regulator
MSTKILIVEDDKNLNMMIQLILKNKKLDWEFRNARDGLEALEILKTYQADLALVDLALPQMDGAELIQRMKSNPALARCKIAVLTSVTDEGIKSKVRAAGVKELWMKPILPDVLFTNLAAMLK